VRILDSIKHEKKRQQILEAAGHCFVRSGFNGASTSDICREAGISPGHLYHYFDSKDAIITALVETRLEHVAERFKRSISSDDSAVATVLSEMDSLRQSGKPAEWALLFEMLAEGTRNRAMAETLRAHSVQMQMLMTDLIRHGQTRGEVDKGIDPEIAAAVLIGVMDGSKAVALRNPGVDASKAAGLFKLLISRFLVPPASAVAKVASVSGKPKDSQIQTAAASRPRRPTLTKRPDDRGARRKRIAR
jgi:TetR/AcrR family transcriptional repressor of uid operon